MTSVSHGKSCNSLLNASFYNTSDKFNSYAVGALKDGVRRIHVVEHASFIARHDKWSREVKEIVLKRENFNFPHKPMDHLDESFTITVPKESLTTNSEFEGASGKRRKNLFMRMYRRGFEETQRYSPVTEFVYDRPGVRKMLFMVEIQTLGELVELVFTLRAPMRRQDDFVAQYGLYLANKMNVRGRITTIRMYGDGFD